jgi:hypothetical protein
MADLYQEITEFSGGIQSSGPADRIPLNSSPRAVNTAFRNIGVGVANLGLRPGLKVVNATAFSGSAAVIFQKLYSYASAGVYTNYLVTLSADGTLRYKEPANTYTSVLTPPANFPAPSSLCFTAAANLVDATVINNRLFLVNSDGEQRSLLGTSYKAWGLTALVTWTAAGAATGVNSMPNETYDVSLTSFDDTTGGESTLATSLEVVIGGASRRIKVDITPTAAESAQYPYWRVYLRRQTTQAELYQVQTLYNAAGTIIVTDGSIPVGTTTAYVDMSAAQIANLATTGYLSGAGDPPPSDIRYITTYGRRLIAASQSQIYWSLLDQPDNFDDLDFEPIETGEGDRITGLSVFSDELLLVMTNSAIYGLFGNDPQTWTLRPIDVTIGCGSHNSIVLFDGKAAWWSPTDGPVVYDGTTILRPGFDFLGKTAISTDIEQDRLAYIFGAADYQDSRVVWTVPLNGATSRNTRMLPYNYRVKQFESSDWSPMDICSLHTGFSVDGTQRLFAGNYAGQVFYFDGDTKNDGVASGTTSTVSFTPATASISTITGTGFDTTGAGLIERYAVIVDSDQRPITKVRITANTSTVLTLSAATSALSTSETYTAYIGSPDMRLYTKWMDMDQTFIRKRFDRVYLQVDGAGTQGDIQLGTQINFVDASRPSISAVDAEGALYDTAIWDTAVWGGIGIVKKRISILKSGQTIRIVLFHFIPDQDVTVQTIGVLARPQGDRYYG